MEPRCPLCGAKTTWVRFPDEIHDARPDLRNRFPDHCHFCKEEDRLHWKDWEQGIDVTRSGYKPMNASVEVPGGNKRRRINRNRLA